MADTIAPKELKKLMEGGEKPVVFDVRRAADFEAAPKTIRGAVRRDPERVDEWSAEIPQDRPIVVYCVKGGSVSQSIADRLQQSHPDVRFLEGGIKSWVEGGEPVE